MKTRYLLLLALGMTGATAAQAAPRIGHADAPFCRSLADNDTTRLRCAQIAQSYGVDTSLIANEGAVRHWMASMGNDVERATQQCSLQKQAAQRMLASLQSDFELRDDRLWIDETTCLVDHVEFAQSLRELCSLLDQMAQEAAEKERARLEQERRAAEAAERARQEALQRDKDQQLDDLHQTIIKQHRQIAMSTDGSGSTDKAKVKELKDLYFAYLSIYNKQDLSEQKGSDEAIARYSHLAEFQRVFLDSIVGANSYANQIANFKNELKVRCGKEFADINKSYLKVFKKTSVNANFSSFEEYDAYVGQLLDILSVQRSYITVIERRQTINKNSAALVERCVKSHKEIASSYKSTEASVDVVPAFTTIAEAAKFIDRLDEFILVQEEYNKVIDRIEAIQKRGAAIVASCAKHSADVASAYKLLTANTNFVPDFGELSGANFYNEKLSDFEALQSCYETVIAHRTTIFQKEEAIVASKLLPKEILAGYKLLKSRTNFTPDFSTASSGDLFIGQLVEFIALQDKVLGIVDDDESIDKNAKNIRSNKDCGNFVKAYDKVIKSYDYTISILSESDLDRYIKHQSTVLNIQEKFLEVIKSGQKKDYDKQLKKEKDLERIKLLFEI